MNSEKNKEVVVDLLTSLLIKCGVTWYPRKLAERLVNNGVTVTCNGCDNFLGAGDFGLCCKIKYDLCYSDTLACERYKMKDE